VLRFLFTDRRLIAWARISLLFFCIAALTTLAPIAAFLEFNGFSEGIYFVYGFLCHQMPERSFWILNDPIAVCSRCFGIYSGLFVGAVILPSILGLSNDRPFSPLWVVFSLVPISIDWSLTYLGLWENTGLSRFLTGGVLGAACGISLTQSILALSHPIKKEELPSGSS